ncbi:MAG: hypothetical protein IID13_07495 [Candidatus Marinimicrobia bacterium]|nr:hypothetical protein [Candidatus Neomarinimicrobiota bacterium]
MLDGIPPAAGLALLGVALAGQAQRASLSLPKDWIKGVESTRLICQ